MVSREKFERKGLLKMCVEGKVQRKLALSVVVSMCNGEDGILKK
jgi:hypothetical protein